MLRGVTPLIRPEVFPIRCSRFARVKSCSPQGLAADTRMKNADSLDVAALRDLTRTRPRRPKGKSRDSASRLHLHTQKIIKNDTSSWERLSKIAHIVSIALVWSRQRFQPIRAALY